METKSEVRFVPSITSFGVHFIIFTPDSGSDTQQWSFNGDQKVFGLFTLINLTSFFMISEIFGKANR